MLTVSIVSHDQTELMKPLLEQLAVAAQSIPLRVVVTENLLTRRSEKLVVPGLDMTYILNRTPKGFGENHNAAFAYCDTPFYCILNPDIRLIGNPFHVLLDCLKMMPGIAAPRVVGESGLIEDSARRVPSVSRLFKRLGRRMIGHPNRSDYYGDDTVLVDWLAGMFLVFDSDVFRQLGGFDSHYYMYCEDVDICLRTWLGGRTVSWVNEVSARHEARRDSHRKLRYLKWHLASLSRLLTSRAYWQFIDTKT
ncbi:glycosyltransferase family 2 protein [Cupriavidus sp. NPDC089707]|uniref:glycosyltransferase family 2 protein n=1 Tax=Cupriavidus sp. NPDC089707 TaxID=3363963 RepID=UPI00381A39D8